MDTPDTFKEYRSVPFVDMDAAPDGGKFVGYAAVFDQEADLGSFTESVNRGAFRKSLAAGDNVPMLYDHQDHLPVLATTRSGTLKLSEDTKGLKVEADIASHFMGEAVREMVKRGDIDGMSWGFVAGPGNSRLEQRSGGKPHRSLMNFKKLLDVSPTWDKTYASTEAAFRSMRMMEELAADLDVEDAEERSPKTYTAAERKAATTMPDGSFPIDNVADLKRAIQSVGRAKDIAAARAWIKKRAKALGASELVPEEWRSGTATTDLDPEEQNVEGLAQQLDEEASGSEPEEDPVEEHRSDTGTDDTSGVATRAAARRRRLQMMGISIPKEYRG